MKIPGGGIGFFDSGLGGLSVLSACLPAIGRLPIYYYGDNLRAPYGNLPAETIRAYAAEAFDVFASLGAKAVVIACNTATAVCADEFRKKYPFPVVGAEPAVFPAARKGGEIFVLATRATVESSRFRRLCSRAVNRYPSVSLRPFACDGLAGAVEKHLFLKDAFDFSTFFPSGRPAGVVLGCTHYVFLKEFAEKFYACPVYDGNAGISRELASVLGDKTTKKRESYPPGTTLPTLSPLLTTEPLFSAGLAENSFLYADFSLPRPPLLPSSASAPLLTSSEREIVAPRNPNICADRFGENRAKYPEKGRFFRVFFLGSGKTVNKSACEQMFVVKNGAGNGEMGAGIPKIY